MNSVSITKLGYIGAKPGDRRSDAWFTPSRYLALVRDALGGIDLDPYSSAEANRKVRAGHYYYSLQNLAPEGVHWGDADGNPVRSCFMNPPYAGAKVRAATSRFIVAFLSGRFEEGIVLINNATETRVFQLLLRHASAVCFPDHRVAFEADDGKALGGNTRGQAFLYFGHRPLAFEKSFHTIGVITFPSP